MNRRSQRAWVIGLYFSSLALMAAGAAAFCWPTGAGRDPAAAPVSIPASSPTASFDVRSIQDLSVGDRVLAHAPEISDATRASWTEPDYWRDYLRVSLVMPKADGSLLHIELLRSRDWFRSQVIHWVEEVLPVERMEASSERRGRTNAPLTLLDPILRDLAVERQQLAGRGLRLAALAVEMDLPELAITGSAFVCDVQPYPEVVESAGRVVTATFHHTSGDVIDLVIDRGGRRDRIGTTSNHPFWSEDRREYVQAGKLEIGERVRAFDGETSLVAAQMPRPGPEAVYNLEVAGEHTYYVGASGVLVHNSSGYRPPETWNEFQAATRGRFASRAEAAVAWRVYQESRYASSTLVIGRLDDTADAARLGYQRLNTTGWTPAVNDAWVQGAIDAGRKLKLVSPVRRSTLFNPAGSRFPDTIFRRELLQLRDAGYRILNGWAIPPGVVS